jgi:hydrogenase maturation protease
VGNILLKDEGVGVVAVKALEQEGFLTDRIEYFDGGTSLFSLFGVLEDFSRIILIDAAEGGGEPGSVYFFSAYDIKPSSGTKYSLHDMGVSEELKLTGLASGKKPDVKIIGIEPFEIAVGDSLSEGMKVALGLILEKIRTVLTGETKL